ncbi:MAG TPA: DUF1573 domain-containing protein [Planctomycetaceae bacterium]|nr:DUF1573 domain-containing protein [Planctomycetaceae bacterium]
MYRCQFSPAPFVLSILVVASMLAGCQPGTSPGTPVPSPTGPQPKVVLPESKYNFGSMEVNQKKQHVFVIKNEGEAPLKLVKGKATCKCTKFDLDHEEVPPGGEARAEVEWQPVTVESTFRQSAPISTNDAAMPEIRFTIEGEVVSLITIMPTSPWQLGELREGEPTKFTGSIGSPLLDAINIKSIETSDPHLKVETTPLTDEERESLKFKSGYRVSATVDGVPVGEFEGKITIETDAREGEKLEIMVKAHRNGPLRIIGSHWYNDRMVLDLGTFDAKKGNKVVLTMFVTGGPDDLKILGVTSSSDALKFSVEADPSFKGKAKKFLITAEVPPGLEPAAHSKGNSVVVVVKTNHPELEEFKVRIYYVSI